jgi:peptidoglycan hydrolase-like protein with peptidoglycan-binding domain
MHKTIFAGCLIAILCVSPFVSSALTADEVQVKINELLSKIADLQAQIKALQGSVTVETKPDVSNNGVFKYRVCSLLSRNLGVGTRGDDVKGLQEFLKGEGYLQAEATGFFGSLTSQAIARWQSAEGLSSVGAFGPLSRERIKIWCNNSGRFSADPQRGAAPLTVTFSHHVGGFRPASVYYTLDYGDGTSERANECPAPADQCTGPGKNTHTYTADGMYTAVLSRITDPCPDDGDASTPRCLAAIQSEVIGKVQITVGPVACTKEYKPVCGSKPIVCVTTPCNPIPTTYGNRCEMNADGATLLYEGQCRTENPADDPQCKAWLDGCNSCARNAPGEPAACTLKFCAAPGKAYCTAKFDTSGGKPPVISSFSGPTTLAEDAIGTWTIGARDPEGGTLSYQVWWGDENVYASQYTTAAPAREFTQSTTFTHAYSHPGTYTISITVRDSSGNEAKTTTTVRVDSNQGTVCTADAMQCPNGEWVGRTGPNCTFVCS